MSTTSDLYELVKQTCIDRGIRDRRLNSDQMLFIGVYDPDYNPDDGLIKRIFNYEPLVNPAVFKLQYKADPDGRDRVSIEGMERTLMIDENAAVTEKVLTGEGIKFLSVELHDVPDIRLLYEFVGHLAPCRWRMFWIGRCMPKPQDL